MNPSEAPRKPSLQSIVPILPVRDMDASVAFYQRLGFNAKPYADGLNQYVFLVMDGLSMHLGLSSAPEFQFNPCGVYFYVREADALYRRLVDAGVPCLFPPADKPWGLREFAVSDPDQTLLRFGELLE